MTRPPQFFTVPSHTPAQQCRFCPATVFMVKQPSGKLMPVDCDTPDGWRPVHVFAAEPTGIRDGCGISHFITCPGADRARGTR